MSDRRWRRGGRLFKLGSVVETLWEPYKRVTIIIEGDYDSDVQRVTQQVMAALTLWSSAEETLKRI